ncbi:LuxR C-terminal-related transcriptional regulator [Streptomyces sp. NPDC008265]|uniref:LuxR C-terminal-related transcriptional regulator n=1 Tax=Streptomyces sp. NPDC008265 TaxID=3364824 RepID=UPI0036F03ACE
MLTARFTAPAVPKLLVHRPGLLERLSAGVQGPLTLINGPAGSGKTVLTAQWAAGRRAPGAPVWLTVEPDDAPGAFWAYVLEALHRGGVELPAAVGRPTRAEGVTRSFLVRLAEGLAAAPRPAVLVLDQFDTARPPSATTGMTEGLDFVLRHSSGGLRVVLTSRTDSLLPLHRYRAAGEITEIRQADLRFTPGDAGALLDEHRLRISPEGVRLLMDRTEGWAAGVRLCALAMQRSPDPEAFLRQFAADRTTIADYLLSEVLDTQPASTQDLLLRVCVTDRVHPGLADALTGRDDGARTLAGLARDNAFLERMEASDWYRLHPLFAEVLRAHLRQRRPSLEPLLHRRAARWLAGTGRLTEAVVQAAAAADWPFAAARLVEGLALGRLLAGLEAEPLGRALAALPAEPDGRATALVGAVCRIAAGDPAGCEARLRRADACRDTASPAAALGRAFVGVLAGRLAGDAAAAGRAAADAERLFREVPPDLLAERPELRALLLAALGAAELGAGRLDRAGTALTAAVAACGAPGTESALCDALGSLAMTELLGGRPAEAAGHARASLAAAERYALPPESRSALAHLVLAGVAVEEGDLSAARAALGPAAAAAGPRPERVALVAAAVIGARIAAAEGDGEGALRALHAVRPGAGPRYAWEADELALAESAAHLACGDPAAALRALDAVPAGGPRHALARAHAHLAAGRPGPAARELAGLPGDDSLPAPLRTRTHLLRARITAAGGDPGEHEGPGGPGRADLPDVPGPAGLPGVPGGERRPEAVPAVRPAVVEALTARETEVLAMAAHLLSTEEIAAGLYVSANTVKTHLKSIYRKLGVTRRSDAVHRAQDLGLL